MSERSESARVLVVVGTDHHPFDRVVTWIDDWLAGPGAGATAVVQYGSSEPPRVATGSRLLAHAELQQQMQDATIVVTHGGPATIMEVRRTGCLPLVVPRDPDRGEHVDSHQQLFSRRMGAAGLAVLCETREAFEAALGSAVLDPSTLLVDSRDDQDRVSRSVARVGLVVDDVVSAARSRGSRRASWRRRLRR